MLKDESVTIMVRTPPRVNQFEPKKQMTDLYAITQDMKLYEAINSLIQRRKIQHQLRQFDIDEDDAIQDIWITLSKYSRKNSIRSMDGYVGLYGPKLINRIIDQAAKHNRRRDPRELV